MAKPQHDTKEPDLMRPGDERSEREGECNRMHVSLPGPRPGLELLSDLNEDGPSPPLGERRALPEPVSPDHATDTTPVPRGRADLGNGRRGARDENRKREQSTVAEASAVSGASPSLGESPPQAGEAILAAKTRMYERTVSDSCRGRGLAEAAPLDATPRL